MTPSAVTAAGRTAATPRPVQAPGVPGHRRTTRTPQAPRGPRRVSGPARARRAAPAVAGHRPSLGARGLLVIRGLPEHALLDRIVRGRAWIPLLGVLLVGIVAMQVEILKLGAGMGRWMQRSSALQAKNQGLEASVAALMDDQRIERLAAKMGMVMPDPTAVSFLTAQPGGYTARAVANIRSPDASLFTSQAPVATAASSNATTAAGTGSGPATTTAAGSSTSSGSVIPTQSTTVDSTSGGAASTSGG